MEDFDAALRATLEQNRDLERRHAQAEEEMARLEEERRQAAEEERERLAAGRAQRHAELAAHLEDVVGRLKASSPDLFVVRTGWSSSQEEYTARVRTRTIRPARTLFIELDRDDDEVLVRWISDVGSAIELWRLLEVDPPLLSRLVLQVADQDLWRTADRPPAFPKA